jgi:uncharacterized SAM-binding protein YcdF (DUF218 family)
MLFTVTKTFAFVTVPSNLIAILLALGAVWSATRWSRAGKRLVITGIMLLLLCGVGPFGTLLLLPLTDRFPAWTNHGGDPDGIIILGGVISGDISAARNSIEVSGAAGRITVAAELARRFPRARIVFSGGSPFGDQETGKPEAPLAGRLLESFGISPDRIFLEQRSRDTAENAALTRELLQPKAGERWLLITSAYHMPRAVGCFRKVGFPIEAYPVDWQTVGWSDVTAILTPSTGLGRTDLAAHEWLGLLAYWLTGRTTEPFPGPR